MGLNFFDEGDYLLKMKFQEADIRYYDRRVRVKPECEKKWAAGQTGIVRKVMVSEDRGYSLDPLGLSEPVVRLDILLDDMDRNVPPFGRVTLSEKDVELIGEPPAETNDAEATGEEKPINDSVNHPSHYTDGKYECIDFIEKYALQESFCLANAVKYLSRAGKKDPDKKEEDLKKALWYMRRYINEQKGMLPLGDISVEDYIRDKGLESTSQGMTIELIVKRDIETAIKVLQLEVEKDDHD